MEKIYNYEDGSLLRPLSDEEQAFIRHEMNRCKVDFNYWLTRYCKIKDKHAKLIQVVPTHVQKLLLDKIGVAELASIRVKGGDGLLFAVLKARQLGVSTIAECIIAHRVFFYGNIAALIASDVDEHTINLYEMVLRVLDNLPWWIKPRSQDSKRDSRVKSQLLSFGDQDSIIRFSSGKNLQGGQGQEKGSIGTGQTIHLGHVSEFALWANAEQVYDALMPAVPRSPRAFFLIESTAKGRGNEWHRTWERSMRGLGRLTPIFFPYYTDPNDYRLPYPTDWEPQQHTLDHAAHVRATSYKWVAPNIELTKEQLYWYERTYAEYKDARMLYKFLAEYAADDLEAFQNTTAGVFNSELLDYMRQRAVIQPIYVEIKPKMQLAKEKGV